MRSSTGNQSYEEALRLLSQLQSNKSIVNLFTPETSASTAGARNLNDAAIPEMVAWLGRAGYKPSDLAAVPTVHVAGTKGKGSVSALVSGVLLAHQENGRRHTVGTYTSPHVASVRERIALDGKPISPDLFAHYFFDLWARFTTAAADEGIQVSAEMGGIDGPSTKPFYFRFLTILAWHVFLSEGVGSAVVECGIGGEYDATNVLPPEAVTAAVITQLGIDHVAMLGSTAEEIAWHKAGIFKHGVKAFTRRLDDPGKAGVMKVLRDRALEKGAVLVEIPDDAVEAWQGIDGARLQGPFQKHNMALAVAVAREHILKTGGHLEGEFANNNYSLQSLPKDFRDGLKNAALRGRCEVYRDGDSIEWYFDGAHTDDSLVGVGQWYASNAHERETTKILVFNQQDRDAAPLLKALSTSVGASGMTFDYALFTRNDLSPPTGGSPGDMSVQIRASEVMRELNSTTQTYTEASIDATLDIVRRLAKEARDGGKSCKVLVTGSFYLVGGVIQSAEHTEP
jgi:folylpolyglutamate synthase